MHVGKKVLCTCIMSGNYHWPRLPVLLIPARLKNKHLSIRLVPWFVICQSRSHKDLGVYLYNWNSTAPWHRSVLHPAFLIADVNGPKIPSRFLYFKISHIISWITGQPYVLARPFCCIVHASSKSNHNI